MHFELKHTLREARPELALSLPITGISKHRFLCLLVLPARWKEFINATWKKILERKLFWEIPITCICGPDCRLLSKLEVCTNSTAGMAILTDGGDLPGVFIGWYSETYRRRSKVSIAHWWLVTLVYSLKMWWIRSAPSGPTSWWLLMNVLRAMLSTNMRANRWRWHSVGSTGAGIGL